MDTSKRRHIFESAARIKSLLETLKTGQNVIDHKGHEPEEVERNLCDILHFRQYANMYHFASETFSSECDEQSYSEIKEEALELCNLLSHDVFNETLSSLLRIKSEIDRKSIEQVYEIYMDRIELQWIDAGLIRNKNNNDDETDSDENVDANSDGDANAVDTAV